MSSSRLTRGAAAARSCSRPGLERASRARRARASVRAREAGAARAVGGGVAAGGRGRSCHDAVKSACHSYSWAGHLASRCWHVRLMSSMLSPLNCLMHESHLKWLSRSTKASFTPNPCSVLTKLQSHSSHLVWADRLTPALTRGAAAARGRSRTGLVGACRARRALLSI